MAASLIIGALLVAGMIVVSGYAAGVIVLLAALVVVLAVQVGAIKTARGSTAGRYE
jgi:hypothetical protein